LPVVEPFVPPVVLLKSKVKEAALPAVSEMIYSIWGRRNNSKNGPAFVPPTQLEWLG